MRAVDEFILYDDAQFTQHDWRNRNRIKTPNGLLWLTIPADAPFRKQLKISEVQVLNKRFLWQEKHYKSLCTFYARAPYFKMYREELEALYHGRQFVYLSDVNVTFLQQLQRWLGIETPLRWSSEFEVQGEKTERLVQICQQAGATHYLSGPAARSYLNEALFAAAGITVEWADYSNYPEYPQLYPPFEHNVTALDLLFHTGPNALHFMKKLV